MPASWTKGLRRHMNETDASALMNEMSHRVKNNMQMLQSLLGLAAREASDPEAREILADISQRVGAMSAAQNSLYSRNATSFEARALLEALVRNASQGFGQKVDVAIEAASGVLANDVGGAAGAHRQRADLQCDEARKRGTRPCVRQDRIDPTGRGMGVGGCRRRPRLYHGTTTKAGVGPGFGHRPGKATRRDAGRRDGPRRALRRAIWRERGAGVREKTVRRSPEAADTLPPNPPKPPWMSHPPGYPFVGRRTWGCVAGPFSFPAAVLTRSRFRCRLSSACLICDSFCEISRISLCRIAAPKSVKLRTTTTNAAFSAHHAARVIFVEAGIIAVGVLVHDGKPVDDDAVGDRLVVRFLHRVAVIVRAVAGDVDHLAGGNDVLVAFFEQQGPKFERAADGCAPSGLSAAWRGFFRREPWRWLCLSRSSNRARLCRIAGWTSRSSRRRSGPARRFESP